MWLLVAYYANDDLEQYKGGHKWVVMCQKKSSLILMQGL